MKLIFEKSVQGRGCSVLPELDLPEISFEGFERERELRLPQMSETDISRHYTELANRTHGVNNGFYPCLLYLFPILLTEQIRQVRRCVGLQLST